MGRQQKLGTAGLCGEGAGAKLAGSKAPIPVWFLSLLSVCSQTSSSPLLTEGQPHSRHGAEQNTQVRESSVILKAQEAKKDKLLRDNQMIIIYIVAEFYTRSFYHFETE